MYNHMNHGKMKQSKYTVARQSVLESGSQPYFTQTPSLVILRKLMCV